MVPVQRTSSRVCVVTGASRGLGEALSIVAAKRGCSVVLVGRDAKRLEAVGARCEASGADAVTLIHADLGSATGVQRVCQSLGGGLLARYRSVVLFNNASTVEPIELFADVSFADIERALRLNVSAPFALASTLARLNRVTNASETCVVNISSGVAVHPVMGWSAYCVSKAALNMVTKCAAIETASTQRPIFALAINPGPLDTQMQERIRSADGDKIPATQRFSTMFSEGKLKKPEEVAIKIFAILDAKEFASGTFVDFNELEAR